IALHRVFDTPRDRFVMDVSHQGYVHKMFTGRLDRFHTMRQFGGLNGFLLRTESEHDCYGAGHAGTALSAAPGMAVGRDLRGHDVAQRSHTVEYLKTQEAPVLLHILTKKGKGYEPAIKQPDKFHGLGKYKIESGETAPTATPTYSEIIGKTLAKFAETNQKVVAITAAMPSGTGLSHFAKAHPTRYFDVGIAEEHATLFACGLPTQGMTPFL